jgi:hypothetical protein
MVAALILMVGITAMLGVAQVLTIVISHGDLGAVEVARITQIVIHRPQLLSPLV